MHRKAIVLHRQQFFLSVQVHGLHQCPRRGTSAVLGFRSRCRPGTAPPLSSSFFLLLAVSLLAASSLPVVTAIACAVMNHLTFSIPHSARHTLFSFPHFLTLLGQKIAIYTAFFYTSLFARQKCKLKMLICNFNLFGLQRG